LLAVNAKYALSGILFLPRAVELATQFVFYALLRATSRNSQCSKYNEILLGMAILNLNAVAITTLAMVAFAANSVLCRLALGAHLIDAASFATVRVVAGAAVLAALMAPRWRGRTRAPADWRMVIMLFGYMVFFSFAYITLSTGTGALILFGAVQLTMFGVALRSGERFSATSWVGLMMAFAGLIYLVSPGVTAPDPVGAVLMAVAGIAWGFYSLLGRSVADPLEATANNFIFCVPLVVVVSLIFLADYHATPGGVILASASGAVASGIGYAIWYKALRGLSTTQAATVQLSVPAIAALGGVLLMAEDLTMRLMLASAATLGGVWIVLARRAKSAS
jgi:drug/metabolite transporter (DMT)-like permease